MNLDIIGRVSRLAAIGAILCCSAACVDVDETLGENFIPTDQIWDVYTPEEVPFENVMLHMADSISGYSNTRFTFGAINDGVLGTTIKSTTFTLNIACIHICSQVFLTGSLCKKLTPFEF